MSYEDFIYIVLYFFKNIKNYIWLLFKEVVDIFVS